MSSRHMNLRCRVPKGTWLIVCGWLMLFAASVRVHAYTFLGPVWPDGYISIDLQLGLPSSPLIDGSPSWNTVARRALAAWNPYIYTVQFAVYSQSQGPHADGDGINQAFFSPTVYGQAFGSGVLAQTTRWTRGSGTIRTEGDSIFNSMVHWDSYRGPSRQTNGVPLYDLQRVAEHEFGHTLGLGHPDQVGQSVIALMNSQISDLDSLAADDIQGISALYPGVPPYISTQPKSQSVNIGSSVTFSVVASGNPSPNYQWYYNGNPVPNAFSSSITLSGVQIADSGTFSVVVFNSHGSVSSQSALLTVIVPPSITTQPLSQVVISGDTVTFSVAASGSAPLSYQWRYNGGNISGATTASYVISNVQATQAGSYTVVVANQGGSVTSAAAVLTVNVPPSITVQPKSQAVIAGKTATLSVGASGTAPLSYQWYRNGSPLAGATGSSFAIASAQPGDTGDYAATVSNIAGSANSAAATLTVQYAPVFTLQPQSQNLTVGRSVTLTAAATGVPAPTYLWKFNGANIPGATSNAYTLNSFQPANAGTYAVAASNSLGYVTSSNAMLAIAVCAPTPPGLVGWWPAEGDATDVTGENPGVLVNGATFAPGKVGQAFSFDGIGSYVRVHDNPSLHCTNGLTIEAWIYSTNIGAYYNVLTRWDVGNPNQASYTAGMVPDGRVGMSVCASGVTSGSSGSTMSTNSILPNQWTHFAATYDGAALRTFVNGVCQDVVAYNQGIFPGNSDLAIGSAGVDSGGHVISPFAGLIDEPTIYNRALSATEVAALYDASSAGKCQLPPLVRTQPANQTALVGDSVTYTVGAGGTPPLSYQWRFNGTGIAMATGSSLELTNVQSGQTGNYDVIVSNNSGSVTSAVATLTLNMAAQLDYDFETAQTIPPWIGATQMVQNTNASHLGTNAVTFTGTYSEPYLIVPLPENTEKVDFYFYDDYGSNPPLYHYMYFWLLEATNATPFAGFSMLDGGWGTTPPMTMNHYYAFANEEYSLRTMGPVRTIGWHEFTFALGSQSVAMSVDGALVFQTNMVRVAQFLKLASASCGVCPAWGRMDDLVVTYATVTQPTITFSRVGNDIRLAWPVSAIGFVLQESVSPAGNWENSTAAIVVQGNENVAVISTSGTARFYRLSK